MILLKVMSVLRAERAAFGGPGGGGRGARGWAAGMPPRPGGINSLLSPPLGF